MTAWHLSNPGGPYGTKVTIYCVIQPSVALGVCVCPRKVVDGVIFITRVQRREGGREQRRGWRRMVGREGVEEDGTEGGNERGMECAEEGGREGEREKGSGGGRTEGRRKGVEERGGGGRIRGGREGA